MSISIDQKKLRDAVERLRRDEYETVGPNKLLTPPARLQREADRILCSNAYVAICFGEMPIPKKVES